MYVNLIPEDLNPDPCLPHLTSIYTCGVTTAPRVCGGVLCESSSTLAIVPKEWPPFFL